MNTKRISRVALLFACLELAVAGANAQNYRGEAIPVVERTGRVELSGLRFQTFVFGREGPMETELSTPLVASREYFVEADVFGIRSAAAIRFELVDVAGATLQTIAMWKATDGADNGEFYGFVTVPRQPFRAVVSGTDTSGAAFRSVLNTLFQPLASGPPEQPILPVGIPPAQSNRLEGMVAAYRRQLQARAAQAAAEHPGGMIALSRAEVSRIAYEPLNTKSGATIGVRLRYTIRFPTRQTIVVVPNVFPVYEPAAWRGVVSMKPLGGAINPAPQMEGVQSLQDLIIYGAAATYQAGATYSFIIDMVPDYVFQGTQTGRFCIHEQKFTNRAVWDAIIASQAAVPYSISIFDTMTSANIPSFFPQRTFYQSFVAGGTFDCGPTPNIHF